VLAKYGLVASDLLGGLVQVATDLLDATDAIDEIVRIST
jgi:hypothetical protein